MLELAKELASKVLERQLDPGISAKNLTRSREEAEAAIGFAQKLLKMSGFHFKYVAYTIK